MKNVADVYHLTPVQREVLGERFTRVVQVRWQAYGELNSEAFERAWQQLTTRHAMLRTCFLMEQLKEPVQVVRQQVKLVYERYDLRDVEPRRQRAEVEDLLRMDRQRAFDPARAPLFRVMEIRLSERSFEVVLSHHPVLLDGHSVRLMIEEVLSPEQVTTTAYRDYVAWVERQDLYGAGLYFARRLDQNGDRRPTVEQRVSFDGGETARCVSLDVEQMEEVEGFARREGLSVESVVTGALALVLMRERNVSEMTVGVLAHERPKGLAQSQRMIGLLENVLPLTLAFTSDDSLSSWLREVERKYAQLQRYAHVSQSQVTQWLNLADNSALFDNTFLLYPLPKKLTRAGLTVIEVSDPGTAGLSDKLRDALTSLTFPALHVSQSHPPRVVDPSPKPETPLDFSLFYFADDNAVYGEDKYRLYREGALFADRNHLTAVWTPERHFHEKAGLYPNPSVLSASLATITKQVKLRAGSVVLPLHNSLRVAEEWSVVDNLSNGRVGVSFTSGWMPNDFAFFPERYPTKRDEMFRGIEEVQRLWRGDAIAGRDGLGKKIDVRIFPKPINPELPIWLTCSGGPEMFEKAGELGFHVLTALLTQSIEEVAPKIQLYRDSLARHGHDPRECKVTMMMHTFIGEDPEAVLQKVRVPLTKYLKSHLNLIETGAQSLNLEVNIREQEDPEKYRDQMAAFAFERYYRTSSLIGTPSSCMKMIERLKAIGVDEVACLIDFGVDVDSVLESLEHLVVLRELSNSVQQEESLLVSTAAHV
jgi:natural product biosynthesis luciferase-like monooxygenase protein